MDVLTNLLTSLYNEVISFVQWVFNSIFGGWNYGVLFGWLPSDFLTAASWLILFLFGLALIKFIRTLLPF